MICWENNRIERYNGVHLKKLESAMAVKIKYDEQAQLHIHWVECFFDLSGKGDNFLEDLFSLEYLINLMPEMYQSKYRMIRIANLEKFKYTIHCVSRIT